MFLSTRRRGARPVDTPQEIDNLTLVINVMKMTLQTGASLPMESWRELLRRLGMMGLLTQYSNLALWLVDWYARLPPSLSDLGLPEARATGSYDMTSPNFLERFEGPAPSRMLSPLASVSNAMLHQNRDLLVLFGRQAQQGIVAWGFQADIKRKPNLDKSRSGRLIQFQSSWQWGLKFLKELEDRGVPIDKRNVAKACKMRLAQLFNTTRFSSRIINRRGKQLNDFRAGLMADYRYSTYVREMEEIWGQDLFADLGEHTIHWPVQRKWRIIQYHER